MKLRVRWVRPEVESRRCIRSAGVALAALVGLGCDREIARDARVCAEILSVHAPGAQLVETWLGTAGVAVDYRVAGEPGETSHRLDCALEETGPGRVRARSLRVDGRELAQAELLLVNSELLLADIRRADPGPSGSARRGDGWLSRLLPRS